MSSRSRFFSYAPLVAMVDLILIHASFIALFIIKWGPEATHVSNFQAYVHVIPSLCVSALVVIYVCNLYKNWQHRTGTDIVYLVLVAIVFMTLATMAISFWERQFSLPRLVILGAAALQFALLSAFRLSIRALHAQKHTIRRVLIVSEDESSARASQKRLEGCAPAWMDFSNILLTDELSKLADKSSQFDAVLLTPQLAAQRALIKSCARLGKTVLVVPGVQELSLLGAQPFEIGDALFLSLQPPRLSAGEI